MNASFVASLCGSVSHGTYHAEARTPAEPPTGWGCYKASKLKPPLPRVHAVPTLPLWTEGAVGRYLPLPAPELHREMPRAVADNRPDEIKYAGMPAALDWDLTEKKVGMMRDQLTCGSCYAFAATSMLASRARIAGVGPPDLYLSPQDMISWWVRPSPKCGLPNAGLPRTAVRRVVQNHGSHLG
eukprot:SAG11_NODE_2595_length_3185_cov_8.000324_3_plen_184_part_00